MTNDNGPDYRQPEKIFEEYYARREWLRDYWRRPTMVMDDKQAVTLIKDVRVDLLREAISADRDWFARFMGTVDMYLPSIKISSLPKDIRGY